MLKLLLMVKELKGAKCFLIITPIDTTLPEIQISLQESEI